MVEIMAIIIACFSLILSIITMWLTLLHKGKVKMTRPTLVAFLPERGGDPPKVFFRTLLYSTGKRGKVVENMFVKIRRGESLQTFSTWAYGDKNLVRGSGIYVGPEGVACNHHFLVPKDGTAYEFRPGEYTLEIYGSLVNSRSPSCLYDLKISLTVVHAKAMKDKGVGVLFDLEPSSGDYYAQVDEGLGP
jgi:hypothetical protein